jgi:hypothetical protein
MLSFKAIEKYYSGIFNITLMSDHKRVFTLIDDNHTEMLFVLKTSYVLSVVCDVLNVRKDSNYENDLLAV